VTKRKGVKRLKKGRRALFLRVGLAGAADKDLKPEIVDVILNHVPGFMETLLDFHGEKVEIVDAKIDFVVLEVFPAFFQAGFEFFPELTVFFGHFGLLFSYETDENVRQFHKKHGIIQIEFKKNKQNDTARLD
jgi:hypothetical protein